MLTSVTCTLRTRAPRAKRNTDWLVSSSHRKRVFIKDRISHFSPQPHTREVGSVIGLRRRIRVFRPWCADELGFVLVTDP